MASLRTQIYCDVAAFLEGTSPVEGAAGGRIQKIVSLVNGTGSGAADQVYFAERTLDATSSEVLDLAGVLADPLGSTLTFAKVKLVAFLNSDSTDGDDLAIGPDATNGWGAGGYVEDASDRRRCNAGGIDIWYDPNGIAVTAGSADEISVTTKVGAVTYRVLIVGTSA
jgi:hypothetical protein